MICRQSLREENSLWWFWYLCWDRPIFLHKTELEKSGYKDLNVGASVSYEIYTDVKGKSQAINIKLI